MKLKEDQRIESYEICRDLPYESIDNRYFEYENNKYYIILLKNKRVLYLKANKDNKFTIKLSIKENEIVNKVYNSLLINTNNSIMFKQIELNNNKYNLFFDKTSHHYFWQPLNNKYDINDNIYLNFQYNHYPITVYSNKIESKNESKFYNKFVKLGSKLIPIFLSASISLTILSGCTVLKQSQKEVSTQTITETLNETISKTTTEDDFLNELIEEIELKEKYDYEKIKQAIENNPNLTTSEKEFIKKLKFIFDENYQYMDLDIITERLQNMTIEYNVNLNGAQACYNMKENKISSIDENFEKINKATFLHEFLHSLQSSGNPFLGEVSTEYFAMETMIRLYKEGIFEKEFFLSEYAKNKLEKSELELKNETEWLRYLSENSGFSSGYGGYVNIYCILTEILPQETIRNYQFNPSNIEILVEAIAKLDKNKKDNYQRALELVESINNIRTYLNDMNGYIYSRNVEQCYECINYYYNQIKRIDLEDDFISSLYMGTERRLIDGSKGMVLNYLRVNNHIEKISTIIPRTKLSNVQKHYILIYQDSNKEYHELKIDKETQSDYKSYIEELQKKNKIK